MQASWPDILFTDGFRQKARQSRILLIGAGGIGCEVLKALVLTGFRKITLIDLDSIETSNLNRQFLFRAGHVGMSKAETAAKAVERFLPPNKPKSVSSTKHSRKKQRKSLGEDGIGSSESRKHGGTPKRDTCLQITPFHADVKDSRFHVDFFKRFDIVLNGLDNLSARLHVNRLCFAANVPLVESGTAGYEGSVTVHIRGQTHCYECEQKPIPKSFPICTIRNTPDKLIHCVVWAKDLLFARLFGKADVRTDLDEESTSDPAKEQQKQENSTSFFVKGEEEPIADYAIRIFRRVFEIDIASVLTMQELWKNRSRPSPIVWPSYDEDLLSMDNPGADVYKVLSKAENMKLFVGAITSIYETRSNEIGDLVFDKEDELSVHFVAAAANLRAICYSITQGSIFEIKGMAGNIVHAIATTNATVAGLVVTEACKILSGCRHTVKETFVGKHCLIDGLKRKRDVLIKSTLPPKKNPRCVVCGRAMVDVELNTDKMTLGDFVDKVIKSRLGFAEPSIVRDDTLVYEEGEGLDECEIEEYRVMLSKQISELPGDGWKNGAIVQVSSQAQQLVCTVVLIHRVMFDSHYRFREHVLSHQEDIDAETNPDEFILTESPAEEEDPEKDLKRKREEVNHQGGTVLPTHLLKQLTNRSVCSEIAVAAGLGEIVDLLDDPVDGEGELTEIASKPKKKKNEDVAPDD